MFPVFTLVRVVGEKPNRESLLYAHAPRGDKKGVTVDIPGHKRIKVNIRLGGSFYHIGEKDGSVKAVGRISGD